MSEAAVVSEPASNRRTVPCDSCGAAETVSLFEKNGDRYVRCARCGLVFLNPQPSDQELAAIYDEHYYDAWGKGVGAEHVKVLKRRTFAAMLERLSARTGKKQGRLLDLGCATGFLLEEARERGFEPFGIELNAFSARQAQAKFGADHVHCGTSDDHPFAPASFDVVIMSDLLEHVRSPARLLAQTRDLLRPGGVLAVVAPNVGGLSRRLLRQGWTDFKREHLFYFDKHTLRAMMEKASFEVVHVGAFPKLLDLTYVHEQLNAYPTPFFTPLVRGLHRVMPGGLRRTAFPLYAGSMMALARRAP